MSFRDLPGAGSAHRATAAEGPPALRTHDWSESVLGSRAGWDESLRAVVSLCEGSALPAALAWGPRLALVANDAWLRACAVPPSSLGRDFRSSRLASRPGLPEALASALAGEPACAQDSDPAAAGAAVAHALSPIRGADGRVAGVFLTVTPLPGPLGESSGRAAPPSAAPLLREVATLTRLHELSVQLGGASELAESLEAVLDTAVRLHGADFGLLSLFDDATGCLRVHAQRGFPPGPLAALAAVAPGPASGACGSCFASARRTVVHDVESDPRFVEHRQAARDAGFRSVHSTPILNRGGEALGVLSVHFARRRRPTQAEMQAADLCARHAADAVESARAREALRASVAELEQSEEALRQADRRKDEFLATLAHELRSPLAPIRTALHVMRLSPMDPQLQQVHAMMERQVAHVVRLVEDLTEVSRITRGKIGLRRAPVDVATLVRDAVETSQPLLDASGHALHVELPAEPLVVHADAVRIVQVLANLLNNAARYTAGGGVVRVHALREGDDAVIRVRDNGMGIAPETLGSVFDLFTQGERASRSASGGLGIGLTIVRSLVELHGGSVRADSEGRGRGSEFTVRLPLSASGDRPAGAGAVHAEHEAGVAGTRVLVVDDDVDAAESLALLVRMLGAAPRVATSGREALRVFDELQPQLVVLDVGLPEMDGHEVARRMRSRPWAEGVIVAALTGWGTDHDRRATREAGCDVHHVKPLEMKDLHALLAVASRGRRLDREA